jgi:hypothetical protein
MCPSSSKTIKMRKERESRKGMGTKQIYRIELNWIRKSLAVADGQGRLNNLEEGGSCLKTIGEIRRGRMNELDPILKSWKVAQAAGKSKRLEKQNGSRRWKKASGRRREREKIN